MHQKTHFFPQRPLVAFAGNRPTADSITPPTFSSIFQAQKAVQCPEAKSVAAGLAPPFAGENAFNHIRAYVEDILLVDGGSESNFSLKNLHQSIYFYFLH